MAGWGGRTRADVAGGAGARPVAGCRGGTCRTVKLSPAGRHRQPWLAGMDSIPRAGTGTRQCGVVGGPSCSSQRQDRALTARERRVAGDQLLFVTPLPCCSPGPPPGRLRAADPAREQRGEPSPDMPAEQQHRRRSAETELAVLGAGRFAGAQVAAPVHHHRAMCSADVVETHRDVPGSAIASVRSTPTSVPCGPRSARPSPS
jgi:hypothetical protein